MPAIQPGPGYRPGRRGNPPRYESAATRDPFTALAFEELQRPPAHRAKDFLGAAATLAIIGVILLQVTNSLARPCRAQLNVRARRGTCAGISAIANHAHGVVAWGAAACAVLAAATFAWYMFWGYKANGHPGGNGGTQG